MFCAARHRKSPVVRGKNPITIGTSGRKFLAKLAGFLSSRRRTPSGVLEKPKMNDLIYQANPVMFRNRPLCFILCCIVPVIGWAVLLVWWIKCKGESVTVTGSYIRQCRGIMARTENTIMLEHVRDVELRQNVLQRFFDVGHLGVSSAAAVDGSIELFGYAHPTKIRDLIYK